MAKVVSVNISEKKGTVKTPIEKGILLKNKGLMGDSHADGTHRQLSLLAVEDIAEAGVKSPVDLEPGVFAENITTEGICLYTLPVGAKFFVGPSLLEVTQIGKECHTKCEIRKKTGSCVMPTRGIFCRILTGGAVKKGMSIFSADAKPRIFILIISDKAYSGERADGCEKVIRETLNGCGEVTGSAVLPDEREEISALMREISESYSADIIFTCGGTGLSPRDVTPEATLDVIEREVPGITEAMRRESFKITPHAMVSRARAGIAEKTLIINLPGSPKAAKECLEVFLPALSHSVAVLRGTAFECGKEKSD